MTPLPADFWQLPAVVVVCVLVIGYLLYHNNKQSTAAREERSQNQAFMQQLVESNDKTNRENTAQLVALVQESTRCQAETATAVKSIATDLSQELKDHDTRAQAIQTEMLAYIAQQNASTRNPAR